MYIFVIFYNNFFTVRFSKLAIKIYVSAQKTTSTRVKNKFKGTEIEFYILSVQQGLGLLFFFFAKLKKYIYQQVDVGKSLNHRIKMYFF